MNSAEIDYALRHDECTQASFAGVFPSDVLKTIVKHRKLPASYVVNTDPASKPGEHWVAFYFPACLTDKVEYFDSFGQPPKPAFVQFAKKYGHLAMVEKSTRQLQSNWSTACGQYCIYYLTLRNRGCSFSEVLKLFDMTERDMNDAWVTAFVNKHYNMDREVIDYAYVMQHCAKMK